MIRPFVCVGPVHDILDLVRTHDHTSSEPPDPVEPVQLTVGDQNHQPVERFTCEPVAKKACGVPHPGLENPDPSVHRVAAIVLRVGPVLAAPSTEPALIVAGRHTSPNGTGMRVGFDAETTA